MEALILDLDGTLIDVIDLLYLSFNEGLMRLGGRQIPRDLFKELLNKGYSLSDLVEELAPPHISRRRLVDVVSEIYNEYEPRLLRPTPNAKEALDEANRLGLVMGLVTNYSVEEDEVRRYLRMINVDGYIKAVVTGLQARKKPSPEGIIKCSELLGVSPNRCVVVGDTVADIRAGKSAGCYTAAVLTGVGDYDTLSREGPDFCVRDLKELVEELKRSGLL